MPEIHIIADNGVTCILKPIKDTDAPVLTFRIPGDRLYESYFDLVSLIFRPSSPVSTIWSPLIWTSHA
jgi:hypothetical protein